MKPYAACAIGTAVLLAQGVAVRAQLPPGADPRLAVVLTAFIAVESEFSRWETPFTARFGGHVGAVWWNCIASYSENYKDSITKERPLIVVPDASMHTTDNRIGCVAQAVITFGSFSMPGIVDKVFAGMKAIGRDVDPVVNQEVMDCNFDVACLQSVAEGSGYNPTIMGHIQASLLFDYTSKDGWNELGTDAGCEVNCRPYSDPTGYKPSSSPYDKRRKRSDDWVPLLEDNGRGFYYFQEHVTPHIGTLGKFRFLPESERSTRVAPKPGYSKDRKHEAKEVIERMAQLDDVKKIQVEQFDDKYIVDTVVVEAFVKKLVIDQFNDPEFDHDDGIYVTPERAIHFIMTLTAGIHDSVIIAWKEKIAYDLVRPTTVIKGLKKGKSEITTWAPGADAGNLKTFPSRDFEAYIRVMPHSEYVSGSACIFQAIEDVVKTYLPTVGLDASSFVTEYPMVMPFESKVEPGVAPKEAVQLKYNTIEEMAFVGSESRLDGGMHFEESVPASKQICLDIGTIATITAFDLM